MSSMIEGRTVTMTVWSSAATKTPQRRGINATYGGMRVPSFTVPRTESGVRARELPCWGGSMATGSPNRERVMTLTVPSGSVGVIRPSRRTSIRYRFLASMASSTLTVVPVTVVPTSGASASAGSLPPSLMVSPAVDNRVASSTRDIMEAIPRLGSKNPRGLTALSIVSHCPVRGLVMWVVSPMVITLVLMANPPKVPVKRTDILSGLTTSPSTSFTARLAVSGVLPLLWTRWR